MNLHFSFKHMEPSDSIRDFAEEKSEKLKKYFDGKITLNWNFTHEKFNRVVHCNLVGNSMDYFAEATSEDFLASIDQVLVKLEKQIRKHKEIVTDHLHKNAHKVPVSS